MERMAGVQCVLITQANEMEVNCSIITIDMVGEELAQRCEREC